MAESAFPSINYSNGHVTHATIAQMYRDFTPSERAECWSQLTAAQRAELLWSQRDLGALVGIRDRKKWGGA